MKVNVDYELYDNKTDYSDIKLSKNYHEKQISELICIYCYKCKYNDHSEAYKCHQIACPLWPAKTVCMKKPHKLSEETKFKLRKQVEINRNKKHEI